MWMWPTYVAGYEEVMKHQQYSVFVMHKLDHSATTCSRVSWINLATCVCVLWIRSVDSSRSHGQRVRQYIWCGWWVHTHARKNARMRSSEPKNPAHTRRERRSKLVYVREFKATTLLRWEKRIVNSDFACGVRLSRVCTLSLETSNCMIKWA